MQKPPLALRDNSFPVSITHLPEVPDIEKVVYTKRKTVPHKRTVYGTGQCVALLQAKGFPIHAGAARNWPTAAKKMGYTVDKVPAVGAAVITKESSPGTSSGHAALVINTSATDITVEEQNYEGRFVSYRTIPLDSSTIKNAMFIHPRLGVTP